MSTDVLHPERWRTVKEALLNLLFPPRCINCRREGEWLCAECRSRIEYVPLPICPKCGRRLANNQSCAATCGDCRDVRIDAIRSVAYSEGVLRDAIHHFKYNGVQALAAPFGQMLYDYWQTQNIPADLLIPVPLHPRRLRERGYNQSLLLAEQLARRVGLPVDQAALRRVKHTRPQVGLGARERQENVADAFECVSSSLAGQRVVLIDDVCTTGNTLEACSQALKAQGVRSVWALTLARAKELT